MSTSRKYLRDEDGRAQKASSRKRKKKETVARKRAAPVVVAENPAVPRVDIAVVPQSGAVANAGGEVASSEIPESDRGIPENDPVLKTNVADAEENMSAGEYPGRAASDAQAIFADEDDSDVFQLVCFIIEGEEFGVPIHRVQEINRVVKTTEIPGSPPYVKGIIDLRGQVIPVIDLRARLGYSERPPDKLSRIVVLEDGHQGAGLVVDAVTQVLRADSRQMVHVPESISGPDRRYLSGIIQADDKMVLVLDCDRVLHREADRVEVGV